MSGSRSASLKWRDSLSQGDSGDPYNSHGEKVDPSKEAPVKVIHNFEDEGYWESYWGIKVT